MPVSLERRIEVAQRRIAKGQVADPALAREHLRQMEAGLAAGLEQVEFATIPLPPSELIQPTLPIGGPQLMTITDGYVPLPGMPTGPTATPMAFPLVAGLGVWTVGMLKALLARFGPTILKGIIGAAAFKEFMDLIFGGAPDDTPLRTPPGAKGRARRYSIGANPRLGTLIKVAKRVDNLFNQYDKRISKFRSRIRGPRRATVRYYPGPSSYLSPVERKQLARGRG